MWNKATTEKLTEAFLDQVAEFFDNGTSFSPDTLVEIDGEDMTADQLLRRIRLGAAVDKLV